MSDEQRRQPRQERARLTHLPVQSAPIERSATGAAVAAGYGVDPALWGIDLPDIDLGDVIDFGMKHGPTILKYGSKLF